MGCYSPWGTPFQKTTPLVYDESLSVAQQIAKIFGMYQEITGSMVTTDSLQAAIDEVRRYVDQVSSQIAQDALAYTDERFSELADALADLDEAMRVWNVTTGGYDRSEDAIRALFNWVTVHSATCAQLAEWGSVDQLTDSGLTVYGLAVYSWWLWGRNFTPDGVFTDGTTLYDVADASNAKNINGYLEKQAYGPAWTVGDWKSAEVDADGYVRIAGQGMQALTCEQARSMRVFEGRVKATIF